MAISTQQTWPDVLTELLAGRDLRVADAEWAMAQMISNEATPAQTAAFLAALAAKGEVVDEIVGFRGAILDAAVELPIRPDALDIVGTGGDRHGSVNISTTAAIIIAAAGIPVAKHGNRSASSLSGSSDVLSALGVGLLSSPAAVATLLDEIGLTFVWAAAFHPGFRNVAAVRAELGVPTVFNILGPLCNPGRPEANVIGVASEARVPLITGVLRTRGATGLVVRGEDGLDELTTTGHSRVWEVSRGDVHEHLIDPRDLGIRRSTLEDLRGGTPEDNAQAVRKVLAGETGAVRDISLLNAAAGIVAYELSHDADLVRTSIIERLASGYERAAAAIDDGRASAKLTEFVAASQAATTAE